MQIRPISAKYHLKIFPETVTKWPIWTKTHWCGPLCKFYQWLGYSWDGPVSKSKVQSLIFLFVWIGNPTSQPHRTFSVYGNMNKICFVETTNLFKPKTVHE